MANSRALRFVVAGGRSYSFPVTQKAYNPSFGGYLPQVTRLPGVDGGFDQYGVLKSPAEVGNVSVQFTLVADTPEAMQTARDAVMEIGEWGKGKLFAQFGNEERFCYARVNDINVPQRIDQLTEWHQPVTVNFQVSDPYWYTDSTNIGTWGDGTAWGSGYWDTPPGAAAPVGGRVTTLTRTTSGNGITYPTLRLEVGVGGATGLTIQRVVDEIVVDEITYSDRLENGDVLTIHCGTVAEVYLNDEDAYNSAFDYLRPDMFRLEPGDNTLVVRFSQSSNGGTLYTLYFDAYK